MNLLFTPNHVQLLNACYPPTSALLTAGPNYAPNSQELSRLTYHASNHPGKLNKLGSELEKRLRAECRKARAGNQRTRASLLITLAIFRALATECRRDLALLSPPLIASVDATLSALPSDLEVVARAASVFTAWTTYTNGHLIGTDRTFTQDYLSALDSFSDLSCTHVDDKEVQNRARLIGFAALTGALNSEALYNDTHQFRAQVAAIMHPILVNMFETDLKILDEQARKVKDTPTSPYLSEFRTRPTIERRAASIHLHVDGDKGPSIDDVSSACLRAFVSLLEHSNGSHLTSILRSSFDNLDNLKGWSDANHCTWFTQKTTDWSQYQYRFAVPTLLIERLLEAEDTPVATPMHHALTHMVYTVFSSPTPLVNLSTSDMLSNLMTLVVRRASLGPEDALLQPLVQCISSLGTHVYYSDQIQDLAVEAINRLIIVEVQGVVLRGFSSSPRVRAEALRAIMAGIAGLMHAADVHEVDPPYGRRPSGSISHRPSSLSIEAANKDAGVDERASRRTKIPPDIWHDTLSLICDKEFAVRSDYAHLLSFYLANEMPKNPDLSDGNGHPRIAKQTINKSVLLQSGDVGAKLLNALHAYIYILATTSSLGLSLPSSSSNSLSPSPIGDAEGRRSVNLDENTHGERSAIANIHAPRGRKISLAFKLLEKTSGGASATLSDFGNILDVLATVHGQLPVRGLMTGLPMLLALDAASRKDGSEAGASIRRKNAMKTVLAKIWLLLGSRWGSPELVDLAEDALKASPDSAKLPAVPSLELGTLHPPQQSVSFDTSPATPDETSWLGVNVGAVLPLLVSNANIQEATALDEPDLLARFACRWSTDEALLDSYKRSSSYENTARGDGLSPLLKISPALMYIENMSMASLARSTRGVGVTDLREALEGRSSMSNPALTINRPASISTLDHPTSAVVDNPLTKTRSRTTKKRVRTGSPNEVKDVLNKLGIGKQNGSLLKASFPALQKT